MREVELKFIVDRETSRSIWTRARALNLVDGDRTTRTLRSIYFDTPDHALKTAGISIRLRHNERTWVQTVKSGRTIAGGLSQADEVEIPAPDGRLQIEAIPNQRLRKAIAQCTRGQVLEPVCETVIKRTSGELVLDNGARAELALDIGDVRANDACAELREVEIELIEGEPRELFILARALLPDSGLRLSRLSKAERGYLLAEKGIIAPLVTPVRMRAIKMKPDTDAERAAQDILRACLDQITANCAATREMDDPEGPHQLRIGLRGLRSAFSVFEPVLASPELSRLGSEARWLGQEVGKLRDYDVVVNDIVRPEADAHPDEPSLKELLDVLAPRAEHQRAEVRKLLAEQRVHVFLLDLSQFVETMGWRGQNEVEQESHPVIPVIELARVALSKRWKKVRRHAGRIDRLDAPQRHELRKQLKKMRYSAEFLASLFPGKRTRQFLKRLRRLQNAFGDLNDVILAKALFGRLEREDTEGFVPQRAIGWIVGAGQLRAETGWDTTKLLWEDLKKTKPFWR